MKKIIIYTLVLSLILSTLSFNAAAGLADALYPSQDATEGKFTYTVDNGEATITGFSHDYFTNHYGVIKEVTIPSTIAGYPVISVGQGAFEGACLDLDYGDGYDTSYLETITISEGILFIENYAFAYAYDLKTVHLPESLIYIGDCTFNRGDDEVNVYYAGTNQNWQNITIGNLNFTVDEAAPHRSSDAIIHCSDGNAIKATFLGNINFDNQINSSDALLMLMISSGLRKATATELKVADVTGDSIINSADALTILQFTTGINIMFPSEEYKIQHPMPEGIKIGYPWAEGITRAATEEELDRYLEQQAKEWGVNKSEILYFAYCEDCGRPTFAMSSTGSLKVGTGLYGTCTQHWTGDDWECQNCGDVVPINVCHTCF